MKRFLVFITSLLLLLTACGQQQGFLFNPHQGRDGITLEFLPDMPPLQVFEGPLYLGLKLSNKGAAEVKNEGYLSIALEKDYVGASQDAIQADEQHVTFSSPEHASFSLVGKTKYDPIGEDTLVTMQLQTKKLDPQLETLTTSIIATVCYEYQTQATANVCIDTDPNNLHQTEKVCQMHDVSLSDQGAPIAVTGIEQTALIGIGQYVRPQFIITVQNIGDGQPLKPGTAQEACSSGPFAAKPLPNQPKKPLNVVRLNEFLVGGYSYKNGQLECSPVTADGVYVVLENGQGTIKCTLKGGLIEQTAVSFQTNAYIELAYAYTTAISTQVEIRRG